MKTSTHFLRTIALLTAAAIAVTAPCAETAKSASAFTSHPPASSTQIGVVPADAGAAGRLVLSNEPGDTHAAISLEYNLEAVPHAVTPLARLQLGEVERVKVTRPGHSPSTERGALHAFAPNGSGTLTLSGSMPMKPGGNANVYVLDITDDVSRTLARPKGQRTFRVVVRLTGKPLFHEVYALRSSQPSLEIASPAGWTDDWQQRLAPIIKGPIVYREACMAFAANRSQEVTLRLLYPAKKIIEVIHNGTGEKLQAGRDWILRDGKLVLPAGTRAPVQVNAEFFQAPRKGKDGAVTMIPSQIRITEGSWYHERQFEVTYEPAARDWSWPAPRSSFDSLPRLKQRLAAKVPVKMILFGDSISVSYNSTRYTGAWPYQPGFGELVARQLAQSGSKITFMNHSRGGETSLHASTQADSQVAWFQPDIVILALGMNDRAPERRVHHRANLERIIDIVRARSPDTEFVIVTPMLNSPKQPTGLDPVKFIRDEALAIQRPGIAHVDLTTTQLQMMERKGYLELSGNGVNHPNDFLVRVYAQRILETLTPAPR